MFIKFAALWAVSAGVASAHTWVEQMSVLAENGSYTGSPGYARGFIPRDEPGFKDDAMVSLYPPNGRTAQSKALDAANRIIPDDLVCKQSQASPSQQNPQFPQLTVQPGDYVALRYLENGHVSLPDTQPGKPGSGGLVYVYATTQSNANPKLLDVMTWQSGSNVSLSQGRLLSVQNYDDGRCHQIVGPRTDGMRNFSPERQAQFNNNGELACETDIQIPKDAAAGPVTLYWVWQWPWLPNQTHPDGSAVQGSIKVGKDETYSTCMDINVVTDAAKVKAASAANANLKGASYTAIQRKDSLINQAVGNFKERAANVTLPTVQAFYGPNNPTGLPHPEDAAPPAAPPAAPSGAPGAPPAKPSGTKSPGVPSGRPQKPSAPVPSASGAPGPGTAPSQPAGAQGPSMVTVTVTVTATPSECIGKAAGDSHTAKAGTNTRPTGVAAAPTKPARVKRQHGRPFGTFE